METDVALSTHTQNSCRPLCSMRCGRKTLSASLGGERRDTGREPLYLCVLFLFAESTISSHNPIVTHVTMQHGLSRGTQLFTMYQSGQKIFFALNCVSACQMPVCFRSESRRVDYALIKDYKKLFTPAAKPSCETAVSTAALFFPSFKTELFFSSLLHLSSQ